MCLGSSNKQKSHAYRQVCPTQKIPMCDICLSNYQYFNGLDLLFLPVTAGSEQNKCVLENRAPNT